MVSVTMSKSMMVSRTTAQKAENPENKGNNQHPPKDMKQTVQDTVMIVHMIYIIDIDK